MTDRFVLMVQPSGGGKFLTNHELKVFGKIPGGNTVQWVTQAVDYLPYTVVVQIPNGITGNFCVSCEIEDKSDGRVKYASIGTHVATFLTTASQLRVEPILRRSCA